MTTELAKTPHAMSADEALSSWESDQKKGLELDEVLVRREKHGFNSLPARAGQSAFVTFVLQFHQPLIYILLAAVGITAALGEWIDSGVIFGVVLVNAMIGFFQEYKAAKELDALANMTITEARVLRGGEDFRIPSSELVPGDIVLLESGDKVPADLRLLSIRDLQIDESTLTGESVPVQKDIRPLTSDTPLAERRNLAFSSTLVTYGQGRGIVVATGVATEVGRISDLVSTADIIQTPLTRKIEGFSRLLLVVILALAGVTFVVGIFKGGSAIDMFMAAVALSVGAIPEGMPAAVTITLAIGVKRMARRRALIRKLPAVETLGSTNIICSDKTGTLTVNQMTVRKVVAAETHYDVTGSGYDPEGEITISEASDEKFENAALAACLQAGLLCNDSSLRRKNDQWEVTGDPTEGALIVSARKSGLDANHLKEELPRVDSVPFESQHQYMATLHDFPSGASRRLFAKGAVEVILSKCETMLDHNGERVALDRKGILERLEALASEGLRVLAFASRDVNRDTQSIHHEDVAGLTFLGLQGMIDPPRPEAIEAVRACLKAGIRVKMITGDHPVTAGAIAEKLGFQMTAADGSSIPVMTSQELEQNTDEELVEIADRVSVFARATPEQKLRLVRAMQAKGNVVAMTGDGVNDAPALKQADIGVAMGLAGTEVAKESADMVLTDDNFATIEAAVEEGRGVFDNLTKFIVWTLPTNAGEGLLILAAIMVGATLPLLPVQILWINMTTAVLLGLMLAFEPKEPDIMSRPPRDPSQPLLTGMLIGRMAIVSAILLIGAFGSFSWSLKQGYSDAAARTVAVNVFVMVEMFYLFNCRSLTKSMFRLGLFTNPLILVGVGIMLVLQLAFTYAPFMNFLFHSAPISWDAWWRILLTAAVAYCIVGFEKWVRRRLAKSTDVPLLTGFSTKAIKREPAA